MRGRWVCAASFLFVACIAAGAAAGPGAQQRRRSAAPEGGEPAGGSRLGGVYRLNVELSDRLYSALSSASTNLPYGEQQRFFIDLTERLTPPDQIAISRRGSLIEIASSRAPRTAFSADGRGRGRGAGREMASLAGESLTISSENGRGEAYAVTFTPLAGGSRLRVTRRITFRELNEPVVIRCVYDRISEVARWEIYGEPERGTAAAGGPPVSPLERGRAGGRPEAGEAEALRAELGRWVEATNDRDVVRQMEFYAPRLLAYYLTRDTPREAVRAEKSRVFDRAAAVSVTAEEPEIVFLDGGAAAVMRFRKRYRIEGGAQARRGEVIQELRWRKTSRGWKIYSERDIRVVR